MTPSQGSASPRTGKAALRLEAESRRRLAARTAVGAAARLAEFGAPEILARRPRIVSGYRAMGDEIDPEPLLTQLLAAGLAICLPVSSAEAGLVFRLWRPGAPLERGMFGAQEPTPASPLASPDLVLTPLLAFDRLGGRLGRGGGHYDRALARLGLSGTRAIGLAYAAQEIDEVPMEAHDMRIDGVLTENGAVMLKETRS